MAGKRTTTAKKVPRSAFKHIFMHQRVRRVKAALLMLLIFPFMVLTLYGFFPPISTLMLGRWITLKPVERAWVPLADIAPSLPQAIIASEDSRFCLHDGVDWRALWHVIYDANGESPSRGASTIPMQAVKNLVLWPGRSYIRKGLEIPLSTYADIIWSKRRMMENYLNIAEWGDGIFGAEAAARHYFNKSAQRLTRREAALLAAALPHPIMRNPAQPTDFHARAANMIMIRMNNENTQCINP